MNPPPRDLVLLVDDVPRSLAPLAHDLEADGYIALIADSGSEALARLEWLTPDAIVLDALMPGINGFETCQRIKAQAGLAHIPVIFMTGSVEPHHVEAAFAAGGVDYVVKPVRSGEVLARLSTHLRNARVMRLAREAVDVGGHGIVLVNGRGCITWQSPKAAAWMTAWELPVLPDATGAGEQVLATRSDRQLVGRPLGSVSPGEAMWLLDERTAGSPEDSRIRDAALTPRESEVLSWVAKGKTNRDIAQILGMSPRTVNKHLEHVFEKLGVETRAAAAALVSRSQGDR